MIDDLNVTAAYKTKFAIVKHHLLIQDTHSDALVAIVEVYTEAQAEFELSKYENMLLSNKRFVLKKYELSSLEGWKGDDRAKVVISNGVVSLTYTALGLSAADEFKSEHTSSSTHSIEVTHKLSGSFAVTYKDTLWAESVSAQAALKVVGKEIDEGFAEKA